MCCWQQFYCQNARPIVNLAELGQKIREASNFQQYSLVETMSILQKIVKHNNRPLVKQRNNRSAKYTVLYQRLDKKMKSNLTPLQEVHCFLNFKTRMAAIEALFLLQVFYIYTNVCSLNQTRS